MRKILNFGSLNIDYVYDVQDFVKKGETAASLKRSTFTGGKGLNQTVAMLRAGLKVYHAGAIGEEGAFLREYLEKEGADVRFIEVVKEPTGHAVIQRNAKGDNCILLYGGANRMITKDHIDRVLSFFEEGDVVVLQNEINENAYIIEKAYEKGMTIVLNPSPMNDDIGMLPLDEVDVFFVNETEGAALSGCGASEGEDKISEKLCERFPESMIVLTLGEKGAVYRDGNEYLKIPAKKVEAVDTTAAGDTFTGYFLSGLLNGKSRRECMELASEASAITVTRPGAAPSIPFIKELEAKCRGAVAPSAAGQNTRLR